mmetsp:Transcript_79865/g.229256  ORF Transcript_79865/g.229256 Transcript_79865/m.229256 type:complete len:268 (+) Transcript_79865:1031-1834(+)
MLALHDHALLDLQFFLVLLALLGVLLLLRLRLFRHPEGQRFRLFLDGIHRGPPLADDNAARLPGHVQLGADPIEDRRHLGDAAGRGELDLLQQRYGGAPLEARADDVGIGADVLQGAATGLADLDADSAALTDELGLELALVHQRQDRPPEPVVAVRLPRVVRHVPIHLGFDQVQNLQLDLHATPLVAVDVKLVCGYGRHLADVLEGDLRRRHIVVVGPLQLEVRLPDLQNLGLEPALLALELSLHDLIDGILFLRPLAHLCRRRLV